MKETGEAVSTVYPIRLLYYQRLRRAFHIAPSFRRIVVGDSGYGASFHGI